MSQSTIVKNFRRPSETGRLSVVDPCSFSNSECVRVEKFKIRWTADFVRQVLTGSTTYEIVCNDSSVNYIILDTNELKIRSVHWPLDGRELQHVLGNEIPPFGRPLTIILPDLGSSMRTSILIDYETSPSASGLQWLVPSQTHGEKFSFLFSQAQPIHARSFFPCQDTPSVKAKFTSEVTAPKAYTVLMSGVRTEAPELINANDRLHKFHQNIPVPSYLIAIVIARLSHAKIGPRTTLWAEDEFLAQAAFDFSGTEEMLQIAEQLIGKYEWEVYDLLVLPRTFSYGGMENPCLTFVTPTLLTGDKSLASVIAHEIAHSWTGNLVTNVTFEHFWLNEGFTVYLERLIMGRMKGEEYRQFLNVSGWKILKNAVNLLGENNPFTSLICDLTGASPDEAFSEIPYDKGCAFLNFLEEKVGRTQFEAFLVAYIKMNRMKSIDSDTFRNQFIIFFNNLGENASIEGIDWNAWLKGRGMPPYEPKYDMTLIKVCIELVERWKAWNPQTTPCPFKYTDLNKFTNKGVQIREFLAGLFDENIDLGIEKLKAMQNVYDLNSTTNCENKFIWLRLCIKAKWMEQVPIALKFVTEQGRLKFIRPIYRDLYSWEEVRPRAIDTFNRNRPGMMFVAVEGVKKELRLDTR